MPEYNSFDDFLDLFTPRVEQVIALAAIEAAQMGCTAFGSEHLLLGILKVAGGNAKSCLLEAGITYEELRNQLIKIEPHTTPTAEKVDPVPPAPEVTGLMKNALREAKTTSCDFIGVEQLLLAILLENEGPATQALNALKVDKFILRTNIFNQFDKISMARDEENLMNLLDSITDDKFKVEPLDNPAPPENEQQFNPESDEHEEADENLDEDKADDKPSILPAYGRDLTEMAQNGKLDPVIGRNTEIQRIIQILCRRTKNNAILIGEAGVGKTAIVEGLAQHIAAGNVPDLLLDRHIVAINLNSLVAGTKYRGMLEERVKKLFDEVKKAGNIVIFIDEIHNIVGAGNAEGSLDISNILKPKLARGELQCIGATTMKEYHKSIEKDSAMERRFQPVIVAPPNAAETFLILKGLVNPYGEHHKVTFDDKVLHEMIALSERYLPTRYMPDKVIDIMDEVGSFVHLSNLEDNTERHELEERLKQLIIRKKQATEELDLKAARGFFLEQLSLQKKLETFIQKEDKRAVKPVNIEDVRSVVSAISGIPLKRLAEGETTRLLHMEEELAKTVVAQDAAVSAISRALRRSRAELKDPRRPIGSFMFLGPTGVGKTLLAKALAEFMFGEKDSLIRLDMSEYMERYTVSRLIGSSPGYVGYEEGGVLTERVRRKPYSVVLFDELEKADHSVLNILLQIMEEGQLTDNSGDVISFRNTVIVMTSNIGAESLGKALNLGFSGLGTADKANENYEKLKERVTEAAKRFLKPEFLNRLDEVVVFNSLDDKAMAQVVDLEIAKIADRIKLRGGTLQVNDDVKKLILAQKGGDMYGARHIRRLTEQYVEDPLADALLLRTGNDPFNAVASLKTDGKNVHINIIENKQNTTNNTKIPTRQS